MSSLISNSVLPSPDPPDPTPTRNALVVNVTHQSPILDLDPSSAHEIPPASEDDGHVSTPLIPTTGSATSAIQNQLDGLSSSIALSVPVVDGIESSQVTIDPLPAIEKLVEDTTPMIDDTQLIWAARFSANLRNLKKASQPTFTEDGTPKVRAPASVILKATDTWKDHIVAHFHGNPPPAGKIFVDLNPIWGKDGRINIRCLPSGTVLIYIPSEATRNWVLEVGCWQAGNCLFTVTACSPTVTLTPLKLVSLPIWIILKDFPPQLYSLPGLSIIASGIGEPLHTEKHQLHPLAVHTRIKVEILLKKTLPQSVLVEDDDGNEVRISVEYPRLPPKCDYCKEFGHLYHRCPSAPDIERIPSSSVKRTAPHNSTPNFSNVTYRAIPPKQVVRKVSHVVPVSVVDTYSSAVVVTKAGEFDFTKSNHSYIDSPASDSASEWKVVKGSSRPSLSHVSGSEHEPKSISLIGSEFAEEEEANQNG